MKAAGGMFNKLRSYAAAVFFNNLPCASADMAQVGLETRSKHHATATKAEQQAVKVFGLGFVT